MAKPLALILTGYGINCDDETAYAFEKAGAVSKIIHINDIIDSSGILKQFQIFIFPGGFSYGDDAGSGKALANKIKNNLVQEFHEFLERDTLMLGICNGFQVIVNLGIVPAVNNSFGEAEVSLEYNRTFRYECRWVDLAVENTNCVFTKGINDFRIPVAHGEGNFYAPETILSKLEKNNHIVMRYVKPGGRPANGEFPYNPNGSMNDIAAICNKTGRVMGMMPHPERNIFFTQQDNWTYLKEKAVRSNYKITEQGEGFLIFRNAVEYFK
ncbi:MAG: phosphoribosylformylglycinamidine synthase I [Spirochaetes bacterium]|nr:phosphoribosylformylglycinamidine synthase I [Spirochaetota bacterium]